MYFSGTRKNIGMQYTWTKRTETHEVRAGIARQ
jgi:hypothetical protein